MTAPTPPAGEGVPVVDCVVRSEMHRERYHYADIVMDRRYYPDGPVPEGILPAIAVPDALWSSEEMKAAILARCDASGVSTLYVGHNDMREILAAVAAELRHRAGRSA